MHSEWQSFLQQQSANSGEVLSTQTLNNNIITDVSQLDVLKIGGNDAADFLHSQFSSDVSALDIDELQLSSWCNIKGRVIATFLLYRSHNAFYLILEKELTESIVKRLQMFVMRAEVNITNQSDELIRIGIRGESVHAVLHEFIDTIKEDVRTSILSVPDAIPRSIVLLPLEQAQTLWQKLAEHAISKTSSHWSFYDIQAGIAWIGKMGSQEFLPQSLNLDLCGGLSFDKGCYPGQEIIARMHFRGKLKQRLFLIEVSVHKLPEIKTKLYSSTAKQHVGMVVNTIMQANDSCLSLVTLDLEFFDKDAIHLGAQDGPALTFLPLPYSIDR